MHGYSVLQVSKADNSEYFDKTLLGPKIGNFHPKIRPKTKYTKLDFVILNSSKSLHLVLKICIKDFSEILHDDWKL